MPACIASRLPILLNYGARWPFAVGTVLSVRVSSYFGRIIK